MTSKTDICNRALLKIGKARIQNIDTDQSTQGTDLKLIYDSVLYQVLKEAEWNFAVCRQSLNRDAGTPLFDWAYQYALPTSPEFIKLIEIQDSPDFSIEGKFIVTNATSLNIKYVGKITDPNQYDYKFQEVFVLGLAREIAFNLTNQKDLVDYLDLQYTKALSQAVNQNKIDLNQAAIFDNTWSAARV